VPWQIAFDAEGVVLLGLLAQDDMSRVFSGGAPGARVAEFG